MTRVAVWLRLLLLATLLAGPRPAVGPAETPARSSWLADDGRADLAARPTQHLRLLVPSLGRSPSPHRPAPYAPSSLPSFPPGPGIVPGGAGVAPEFRAAAHGAGSPRFPTGPPAALPTD
ncbi:MAG TPA: hypothetical protein VJQ44_05630 [Gemmatimonadales bacterium]|nr:hypothetical protein [Gemmatimonadales bacterium]